MEPITLTEHCPGELRSLSFNNIPQNSQDEGTKIIHTLKEKWLETSESAMNEIRIIMIPHIDLINIRCKVEISDEKIPKNLSLEGDLGLAFQLISKDDNIEYSAHMLNSKKRPRNEDVGNIDSLKLVYIRSWGDTFCKFINTALYTTADQKLIDIDKLIVNISSYFSTTTKFINNLRILLQNESCTQDKKYMSLDQYGRFATRFGPLVLLTRRVRDFIRQKAKEWYHGEIKVPHAEALLQAKNAQCYLIRNSTEVLPVDRAPDTAATFSISWLNPQTSSTVQHLRLYVNREGRQGYVNNRSFYPVLSWVHVFNQLHKDHGVDLKTYIPIPDARYDGLEIENDNSTQVIEQAQSRTEFEKIFDSGAPTIERFSWNDTIKNN
jgi:hypothetical protein